MFKFRILYWTQQLTLLYTFILTSLLDFFREFDYFRIHMDFVFLYGSTE